MHAAAAQGKHVIIDRRHVKAARAQLFVDIDIMAHRQNTLVAQTHQISTQFDTIGIGHRDDVNFVLLADEIQRVGLQRIFADQRQAFFQHDNHCIYGQTAAVWG